MHHLDRRQFVKRSAASIFFLNAPRIAPRVRRKSPNEEVRVAVVGLRGRGAGHVKAFREMDDVRVVALCDVDEEILAREAVKFQEERVGSYVDLRHVLERDDVDAISIASPNHWHSLQAIWSCQAGKDVYVEKPVSHNVWEGRQLVKAAREHDRIVQTGTQSRSSEGIAEAIRWLQAGNLGRIELAHGFCYKPRKSIGKVDGPQEIPETVDYDLWTGPAPLKPLMRKKLHYDWHWDFDTGNGDLGNQGVHQMDICRWVLGERTLAPHVLSVGGRFGYLDDADTPNTLLTLIQYETAPLLFEVRGLPRDLECQEKEWSSNGMDDYMGIRVGVVVHCEKGTLRIPDYHSASAHDPEGAEIQRWEGSRNHYANFIEAVRSRRRADLTAEIEEGHLSSALCHQSNVSYLCGIEMNREEARARIDESSPARESYDRLCSHLDANGLDPEQQSIVVGAPLGFDPAGERFVDEHANRGLSREYRDPFIVPKTV